jgi:hypothetical protein
VERPHAQGMDEAVNNLRTDLGLGPDLTAASDRPDGGYPF